MKYANDLLEICGVLEISSFKESLMCEHMGDPVVGITGSNGNDPMMYFLPFSEWYFENGSWCCRNGENGHVRPK